MTSSPITLDATECYVFCYLPDRVEPVVCGKFEHVRTSEGMLVGRFAYGRSYLRNPAHVPLDPVGLPIRPGTVESFATLRGVPGALRDASPDWWGRLVIERAYGARSELPELVYLLAGGDDRAGALAFGPTRDAPTPPRPHQRVVRLPDLLKAAETIERDGAVTPATREAALLLMPGISMGGARPKVVIEDGQALWIAKFPSQGDRWNLAAAEAGLLTLASRCGMRVPAVRVESVAGRPVFMVRRFDRTWTPSGYTRARFLSALTVLGADEVDTRGWSYMSLAEELQRRSSEPDTDRRELFRRMVFNALVTNTDDHPRNHALIAPGADDWRLSELFDVVPAPRLGSMEHDLAMACGRYGYSARRVNLVSEAPVFRVNADEANEIISEIKTKVLYGWEDAMRAHGATQHDLDAIRPAICSPGFEYPAPEPP